MPHASVKFIRAFADVGIYARSRLSVPGVFSQVTFF